MANNKSGKKGGCPQRKRKRHHYEGVNRETQVHLQQKTLALDLENHHVQ